MTREELNTIAGTGDSEAKYDELIKGILGELDKVVFLFDYDSGGLKGWKKVKEITTKDPSLASKVIPLFYQEGYGTNGEHGEATELNGINMQTENC